MNSKIEKPTKEQLKAQSYDRHLTVTANAGTGKTRVLVHRYLNILLGVDLLKTDIEPQEVVAITFTRKAASEMLAKIAQNIEEKLKTCENKILSQRLEYIRENLIYANISTIHSFCSKLLRDYPIEAGINPAFVELSEPEKLSFQDQAITEVFEDWLETELDEKRVTFKNLLDILPEYKLRNLLKLIFNKRAITQNLIKLYSKSNSEILEKRDEYLKNLVVPTIVESINKLFNFFDKYNTDNLKAGNAKKLEEAFEHLKDFKVQLNSKSKAYSLPELIDKTLSIINEFFTQSFTIRKTYQNDENFTLETVIGNSASIIETFSKLLEVLKYESLDKELIQATRTVIDVYRDVEQSIKQRKDELGALDFDDFILLTYNLLRNEEVRRKVAKNLKYLLVDEFQDTDDFQYSIMKNLIGDFSGIEQNNNLFIVGDAKQSIYGFRNADVRIFNKARAEVREINRKKLEQQKLNDYFLSAEEQIAAESDAEREGELQLTATFRMQPNICSFVNTVCSNIFADKSNNYDVEYSPLVCAKNAEEFFQSEDKSSFGTVSFLTSFEQKNEGITLNTSQLIEKKLKEIEEIEEENEEENREEQEAPFLEEAELVARYIKNAVESSSDIFIEEKGEKRKPKYNDFAVLSRTRSSFESLVFYCLKYEIPHILHSGSGFFNNQEIIDVYSFLSFLNNPNDDLAFASILKS
ncbi:MAG TPA: UvrD-helicase domain-containing protein, partial [Candidatus Kapabacteria bacterium]|nr:UvrD-helicase domain-containing protein [Candidatus Kapabacteria bacterium]